MSEASLQGLDERRVGGGHVERGAVGGDHGEPLDAEPGLAGIRNLLRGDVDHGVTDVEIKTDVRIIAAFYTGPDELDETALTAYVDQRLARYKQPRTYIRLQALPTNPNGKLLRRALKSHYESPS